MTATLTYENPHMEESKDMDEALNAFRPPAMHVAFPAINESRRRNILYLISFREFRQLTVSDEGFRSGDKDIVCVIQVVRVSCSVLEVTWVSPEV